MSVGDRVGYVTRSHLGGSYADFTVVASPQATQLPEGVSTQDAAAVLLQGLTALSQATVAISNEIKPGWWGYLGLWLLGDGAAQHWVLCSPIGFNSQFSVCGDHRHGGRHVSQVERLLLHVQTSAAACGEDAEVRQCTTFLMFPSQPNITA